MLVATFLRHASPRPARAMRAAHLAILIAIVTCFSPAPARAQVLGTWATAVPYDTHDIAAGGFLLVGEPIGIVGQLRTGLDDRWDLGIQLGFPNFDTAGGETLFGIAGDTKYLILPEREDFPLDLALDVGFGYQRAGDFDLVDFDFGLVGSKAVTTDGGTHLAPYGALMLAVGRFSVDIPPELEPYVSSNSDTELDVHVRMGVEWPMRPGLDFLGELNLSSREDTISISAGLMTNL